MDLIAAQYHHCVVDVSKLQDTNKTAAAFVTQHGSALPTRCGPSTQYLVLELPPSEALQLLPFCIDVARASLTGHEALAIVVGGSTAEPPKTAPAASSVGAPSVAPAPPSVATAAPSVAPVAAVTTSAALPMPEQEQEHEHEQGVEDVAACEHAAAQAFGMDMSPELWDIMFGFAASIVDGDRYDMRRIPMRRISMDACNLVQVRQVKGLGRCVFARADIPRGIILGWYEGLAVEEDDVVDLHPYAMSRNNQDLSVIIGDPFHWASYINDVTNRDKTANVTYHADWRKGKGMGVGPRGKQWRYIQTTRRIREGEELLTDYGEHYWTFMDRRREYFAVMKELALTTPLLSLAQIHDAFSQRCKTKPFNMALWEPLVRLTRQAATELPAMSAEVDAAHDIVVAPCEEHVPAMPPPVPATTAGSKRHHTDTDASAPMDNDAKRTRKDNTLYANSNTVMLPWGKRARSKRVIVDDDASNTSTASLDVLAEAAASELDTGSEGAAVEPEQVAAAVEAVVEPVMEPVTQPQPQVTSAVAPTGSGSGPLSLAARELAVAPFTMQVAWKSNATLRLPLSIVSKYDDFYFNPTRNTAPWVVCTKGDDTGITVTTGCNDAGAVKATVNDKAVTLRPSADARMLWVTEMRGEYVIVLRASSKNAKHATVKTVKVASSSQSAILKFYPDYLGPHETTVLTNGDVLAFFPSKVSALAELKQAQPSTWFMLRILQDVWADGAHPLDQESLHVAPRVASMVAALLATEAGQEETAKITALEKTSVRSMRLPLHTQRMLGL